MIDILGWFVGMPGFLWDFVVALGWWWLIITFAFWLMYVIFQIARKHFDKETGWKHYAWGAAGIAMFILGGLTDVAYQHTLAWAAFKDAPIWGKEWTLTQRLGRYLVAGQKAAGVTWFGISRYKIADWICTRLLDRWEDGGHCRRSK